MAYEKLLNEIYAITVLKYFWEGYHEGYVKWESPDWFHVGDDIGIEVSQALMPRDGQEESFIETYLGRPKDEIPEEAKVRFGQRLYFYNNRLWALLDDGHSDISNEEKILTRFRAKLAKLNTNYRRCATNALYLFAHAEMDEIEARAIETVLISLEEAEERRFDLVFLDCKTKLFIMDLNGDRLTAVPLPEKALAFLNEKAEAIRAVFPEGNGTPYR